MQSEKLMGVPCMRLLQQAPEVRWHGEVAGRGGAQVEALLRTLCEDTTVVDLKLQVPHLGWRLQHYPAPPPPPSFSWAQP